MITYNNSRGIPNKWPAMIVKGDNVTTEQAAEILMRTDYHLPFFEGTGNDERFGKEIQDLFGVNSISWTEDYESTCEKLAKAREKFRKIELSYLHNDRIISSWIGGPKGWCNWDGTIGSRNYNIGKWPSVEDVAEDWNAIAEAFPFLNLQCQLFDGETCEEHSAPILIFTVKDGNVVVEDSDEPIDILADTMESILSSPNGFFSCERERGISVEGLRKKIEMVYGKD